MITRRRAGSGDGAGSRAPLLTAALLLASVAILAGSATRASAASPLRAQPSASANWAGYVATGPGSTATTADPGMAYTDVTGQWVEPQATCDGAVTSVAIWVGLGGFSVGSNALEQTGTAADCLASGKASYYAWYELVPADAVTVGLKIDPGDVITSSVVDEAGGILVQVIDRTRRTRFTKRISTAAPDLSSADWVVEAPAGCSVSGSCRQLPITRFDMVDFTHTYARGNGVAGTITSPAWTATAIALVPQASSRVFADGQVPTSGSAAGGAMPVGLAADGSGFAVVWQPTAAGTP